MAFQWSSPVRKDKQGVLLPPIPNEIFAEVLEYIQPEGNDLHQPDYHRTLSRMALVCRYFCSLMVPRLFEKLLFDGSCYSGGAAPDYSSLCRAIVKNQQDGRSLAKHVRTCHFVNWPPPDIPKWVYTGFLKLYFSAMDYMGNLLNLHLQNFVFTGEHIRAISQLEQLRGLDMSNFSIEESGCSRRDYQKLAVLKLKTLKITVSKEDYNDLTEALDFTHLTTLSTCLPSSIAKIEQLRKPLFLRDLVLTLDHPLDGLKLSKHFFQQLPELRRFKYTPESESIFQGLVLDASCVPHLQELHCCPLQIPIFLPGRPVSSIILGRNGPSSPTLLQPLMHTSTRLKCLKMPFPLFLYCPGPRDYLSRVDCLCLMHKSKDPPEHDDEILEEVVESLPWSKAPHLKCIYVRGEDPSVPVFRRIDLKSQHSHLRRIPMQDPGNLVFQLGGIVWTRDVNGVWVVEFEMELRKTILSKAKLNVGWEEHIRQSDHGDYLKALLGPHLDGDSGSETESETESDSDASN